MRRSRGTVPEVGRFNCIRCEKSTMYSVPIARDQELPVLYCEKRFWRINKPEELGTRCRSHSEKEKK